MSEKNNSRNSERGPLPSGQGMGRRPFMIGSLVGLGAVAIGWHHFAGGSAAGSAAGASREVDLASYQPTAFNATEWRFLLAACDRLIPSDASGPGALDTNVPVFIDRQMLTPYGKGQDWYMSGPHDAHASKAFGYQMPFDLHTLYRKGIALTDKYSINTQGKAFADLTPQQQDTILLALEKNTIDFAELGEQDLSAGYFFTRFLENTKEGYLADPEYGGNKGMAAWIMINFPGARASFTDWITKQDVIYPLKPVSLDGTQA